MDRALPCGGRGRRFKSSWARYFRMPLARLLRTCPEPFLEIPRGSGVGAGKFHNSCRSEVPIPWRIGQVDRKAGEEGWPSGRRRSTRNRLGAHKVPRGFKSLSLRCHSVIGSWGGNPDDLGVNHATRAERCESWLNRHAWRACVPQKGTVGSNPTLSARDIKEGDTHLQG